MSIILHLWEIIDREVIKKETKGQVDPCLQIGGNPKKKVNNENSLLELERFGE
jgi:hypothetical protein